MKRKKQPRFLSIVLGLLLGLSSTGVTAQPTAGVSTQGMPRVMVLIQEKVMGLFGTSGWESPGQAELSISEAFIRQGFPVVDPKTVRANVKQSMALKILEGDKKSAAFIAQQMGAEYIVVGTAISKPAGAKIMGTQMKSIQATITARVIQKDDARIVATGTETAAKAHIDEVQGGVLAIQEAADKLADKLATEVRKSLDSRLNGEAHLVTLNISNLLNYPHLDNILYFLESKVDGVSEVYLRDYKNSVADIGVKYSGLTAELSRVVVKKQFGGFRLVPKSVTGNRVDLSVVLK